MSRERHGGVRARARGPKRANSDKALPYRSDPLAQGSVSGGTRRAPCGDSHLFAEAGEHGACRARCPLADLQPGISERQQTARLQAGQQCAAMARDASGQCSSSCAMAAPLAIQPGARRRGWRAGRRSSDGSCAPRDSAWPGARATAWRPSGRHPFLAIVSSRHAACPRGQARSGSPARTSRS
jgi:hypothetical protein